MRQSRITIGALAVCACLLGACGSNNDNNDDGSPNDMSTPVQMDMGAQDQGAADMTPSDMAGNNSECGVELVCDPDDPANILARDLCTGETSVRETCSGAQPFCNTKSLSGSYGEARCATSECDPKTQDVCDSNSPYEVFERDACTGERTLKDTCDDVGEGCTQSSSSSPARCGNICGDTTFKKVCKPGSLSTVYWSDECGNVRDSAMLCSGDKICTTEDPDDPSKAVEEAYCGEPECQPQFDTVCDPDNGKVVLNKNTCTGATTVKETCTGNTECKATTSKIAVCFSDDCVPEFELVCDPNQPRAIVKRNSCTGELTVESMCTDVGEGCVPGRLSSDDPRCGDICGSSRHEAVCDPNQPGKVFWTNECGEITDEKETCVTDSTCVTDEDGEGSCSCVPVETDCRYDNNIVDYYKPSFVVEIDSCGGRTDIEECAFGARCFQEDGYNNGEAECTRSLDPVQAASPYYDHGCFGFSELTRHKTSLAVDCRCRFASESGMGAGYADPITKTQPGNALEACQEVAQVANLTWPVPAGSGPKFSAFFESTSAVRWHGGWLDEAAKKIYSVVTWTNADHRQTGTVVSVHIRTGEREIISGIYPDQAQGEISFGSGYESPNDIAQGPATQPLSAVNAMRIGPDNKLYTLGLGTTGEGESVSAEIVRVDPVTGARTLVWQSQTIERGINTSPYGQCLRHNYVRQSNGVDAYESVAIRSRSFAVGPQGQFYLTFNSTYEGVGVIEISADGSSCEFVSRWGAREFRLTPQDPLVPAPADIGTGFTPQYGPLFGPGLIRNGKLYLVTSLQLDVLTVDLSTGDRVAVSMSDNGFGGMGRTTMIHDPSRNLLIAAGGPSAYDGAFIDEATGKREPVFADSSEPGTPMVESVYGVRRSVSSWVGTTLYQGGYIGYGPMFIDPDDPDILWFLVGGGALLKFEISTFNNYIFSL